MGWYIFFRINAVYFKMNAIYVCHGVWPLKTSSIYVASYLFFSVSFRFVSFCCLDSIFLVWLVRTIHRVIVAQHVQIAPASGKSQIQTKCWLHECSKYGQIVATVVIFCRLNLSIDVVLCMVVVVGCSFFCVYLTCAA